MKLRLDLLEQVTAEDLLEEVLANNHRCKAEPLFSKTRTGSLSSASMKELAEEEGRNTALIRKLTEISPPAAFAKEDEPVCNEAGEAGAAAKELHQRPTGTLLRR